MSKSSCPVQSCNAPRRLSLTRLPIGGRAIASAGTLRSRREPTLQRTEPTVHAPSVSYADSMVLGATAKPGDCGDDEPAQEPLDSTRLLEEPVPSFVLKSNPIEIVPQPPQSSNSSLPTRS